MGGNHGDDDYDGGFGEGENDDGMIAMNVMVVLMLVIDVLIKM